MRRNLTEEIQELNTNFELLKSDFSAASIENSSLNERLFALQRQYLKVRTVLELLKFPPQ